MKRRLLRRAGRHEAEDINITAFMNLMVILVPFLLMTAVFSRITILELKLPAGRLYPGRGVLVLARRVGPGCQSGL